MLVMLSAVFRYYPGHSPSISRLVAIGYIPPRIVYLRLGPAVQVRKMPIGDVTDRARFSFWAVSFSGGFLFGRFPAVIFL